MGFSVEGQSCPVCHAYLFDEDDVVICPVCGAPHHRDCYEHIGHCALEHLHGTEEEYKPPVTEEPTPERAVACPEDEPQEQNVENDAVARCRRCGMPLSAEARFCPRCQTPTLLQEMGGIGPESEIEGVKAKEIAAFVTVNPARYILKFFTLSKKRKISWNWGAFLFPCEWSLFRKNFSLGILLGLLMIASSLLALPLNSALSQFVMSEGTYSEIYGVLLENMDTIGILPMALSSAGTVLQLLVRLFAGLFADYFYRARALDSIKEIRGMGEDAPFEFRKRGGVNLFWFLGGWIALNYVPQVIFFFLN